MRTNWDDSFNPRTRKGLAVLSPFSLLNYAYKSLRNYVNYTVLIRQVVVEVSGFEPLTL